MNPYASYAKNQVENASQEEIMLQLYQGAIVRLRQARELWAEGERVRAMERRSQAQEIISYLDNTLDMENGGEIAEQLDALYAFMIREINTSTSQYDFERLQTVEELLESMLEGWKDVVQEYRQNKAAEKNGSTDEGAEQRLAVGA